MSIRWMNHVWENTPNDILHSDLLILLVLADYSNDEGISWPAAPTIGRRAKLSERQVRRRLDVLEEKGHIEMNRRDGKVPIIRLLDNPGHRDLGAADPGHHANPGHPDARATPDTQMSDEPPMNHQESVKRESASDLTLFDEFYDVWPRKVGKAAAKTAYLQAIKRVHPSVILGAAVAWRDNPHRPPTDFIPHASTWLRRDGWEDELPGPRTEVVKHAGQPVKPGPNERTAAILGLKDPRLPR